MRNISVIKRDGVKVNFDTNKISAAMLKAYDKVYKNYEKRDEVVKDAESIRDSIFSKPIDCINVEEIQDMVEELLMSKDPAAAKEYILYRGKRSREREKKSVVVKNVWQKIIPKTRVNDNANVDDHSFSGREKEASSALSKTIAVEYGGLDPEVAKAHRDMLVYQHDLEKAIYGSHNCLNLNFKEIFTHGFSTRNGDVRPPSSYSTACQLLAVAFQCQSQVQYGGVGTIHLDYDLAPYVQMSYVKHLRTGLKWLCDYELSKDIKQLPIEDNEYIEKYPVAHKYAMEQLEKEIAQASEGLYHNLNTLESRQGSQVPFTSINLGRDTSPEGRMIIKGIFNASLNGIGKFHKTSIFPISIFQHKRGCNANPGDPNYDMKQLALKSLAKRIYPNFVNCDWAEAHETEGDIDTYFSTMGKCKCSSCKIF